MTRCPAGNDIGIGTITSEIVTIFKLNSEER